MTKRFGMLQISLNPMGKRKSKPSRLASVMAGSRALVRELWNLKGGWPTSLERTTDSSSTLGVVQSS